MNANTTHRTFVKLLAGVFFSAVLIFSAGCGLDEGRSSAGSLIEVGRIQAVYDPDEFSTNGPTTQMAEVNGRILSVVSATLKHVNSPSFVEVRYYEGVCFDEAISFFSDIDDGDGSLAYFPKESNDADGHGWSTTPSEMSPSSIDGHDAFFFTLTRTAPGGKTAYARYCCIEVDENSIGLIMAVLDASQNDKTPNLFDDIISDVVVS